MRFSSSEDILQTLLECSTDLVEADESMIYLWDEKLEKLFPSLSIPEKVKKRLTSELTAGENFIWKTHQTNEPLMLDSQRSSTVEAKILGLKGKDIYSCVSVPISEKEYHFGVMVLVKKKLNAIRMEEVHLLTTLANQVAILLDNRKLVQALEEKAQSLEGAYSELQRSQQQVIQLQKMESIGTLVGGIAHDFNNILGIILPNTDLIKNELDGKSVLLKRINIIADAAQRAADLTKQLLMFSRHQDIQVKLISPNQLVTRLSGMFERTLGKEYDILIDLDPDVEDIEGDENRITQVMINLALNARDSMPDGGEIAIRTTMCKYRPKSDKKSVAAEYVCISLTDSGYGIKETDLDKIFDPFFTTKSVGKGTGLGLSVVYGIMQSHRGFVEVESEINEGTTFQLYFPPAVKVVEENLILDDKIEVEGNEKILIVDDEKMIRESVKDILESLGYNVEDAASGPEAIKKISQKKPIYDLVIIDLSMPRLNGIDTIRKIREFNSKTKFILSSGHLDKEKIVPKDLRIEGLLLKPYRFQELAIKVRQVLNLNSSH
jgi:signal transduction histidine kinase